MSEGRRVRSVRLRAATPALVQRGALLLEDALRTASMPDPGRGRVLFIRSLAVGTIRPDRSSSSLALALERRVRALASTAMHAEEEGAEAADAVYFADAVQALVAVAARIGAPGAMGAWFWPLVVPEAWGKPRDEALRAVLRAALEAEPGPAAAVALVEGLVERGAVAPLLGALRWSDGPGLARAFWGLAPEVPRGVVLARAPAPEVEAVPPGARKVLEEWVGTWGPEDLRSVWLAAVVLSMPRPARVVEAELPARAMRVVAAVAPVARSRRPPPEEPVEPRAREVPAPVQEEVRRPRPVATAEAPPAAPRLRLAPEAPEVERKQEESEIEAAPEARRPAPPSEPPAGPARRREAPERAPAPSVGPWPETPQPTRAGGLLFLVHALDYLGLPGMLEAQPALQERAVAEHFLAWVARRLGIGPEDPVVGALRLGELPPLGAPCAFEASERFRERSGARLPWRESATNEGRVIEADARERMVLAVRYPLAREAGVLDSGAQAPDSTLREARTLAPGVVPDSASREAHIPDSGARVPDSLPREARAPAPGATPDSTSREAHIPDSSARAPDSLPREGREINRLALARTSDLELLLRTLSLATARLLRTRAKLSLRSLVLRPARVAATRTHLDVLFDHTQADFRIRSAGLDIDPGWVPWLGRVIRYHYLYGELPPA